MSGANLMPLGSSSGRFAMKKDMLYPSGYMRAKSEQRKKAKVRILLPLFETLLLPSRTTRILSLLRILILDLSS
jgi:hypothetical protein